MPRGLGDGEQEIEVGDVVISDGQRQPGQSLRLPQLGDPVGEVDVVVPRGVGKEGQPRQDQPADDGGAQQQGQPVLLPLPVVSEEEPRQHTAEGGRHQAEQDEGLPLPSDAQTKQQPARREQQQTGSQERPAGETLKPGHGDSPLRKDQSRPLVRRTGSQVTLTPSLPSTS